MNSMLRGAVLVVTMTSASSDVAHGGNCSADLMPMIPLEQPASRNVTRHFLDANEPGASCPGVLPIQWLHYGDDYGAAVGKNVVSVEQGTVVGDPVDTAPSEWDNHIIIYHAAKNRYTAYWHLAAESIPEAYDSDGASVPQGAVIGQTFVNHLHFELYCDSQLGNQHLTQPCLRQNNDEDIRGIAFNNSGDPSHPCRYGPNGFEFVYPDPIQPDSWNHVHFCAYDDGVGGAGFYPGILRAELYINGTLEDSFDLSEMGIRVNQGNQAYYNIFNWQEQNCGHGRYYLSWYAGPDGTEETIRLEISDCKGNTLIRDTGPVGIDRYVTNFQAQWGGAPTENHVTWVAQEFDPGTYFVLKRSDDGGMSYQDVAQVPYSSGFPLHEVNDPYTYHKQYVYRLWDSEGGGGAPGPDPWWDPPAVLLSETGSTPPAPSTAPSIVVLEVRADGVRGEVTGGSALADAYEIEYGGGQPAQATIEGGGVAFDIGGLTEGATYTLIPRATNLGGQSPDGSSVQTMPLSAPSNVYVVPGETLLNVSWSRVDAATGYEVSHWPDAGGPTQTVDVGDELNTAITGLSTGQVYCVSVSSYNSFQQSTAESPMVCKTVGGPGAVAVEGASPPSVAAKTVLRPGYPNPFNPSTRFEFSVPGEGPVRLAVWDATGRRRAVLLEQSSVLPGEYSVQWDGRDDDGRGLAAGVYFVRLEWRSETAQQKVVLVK